MEPTQILDMIDKLFMTTPIYVFGWCLVCLALLGVYKFMHPEKSFPEFVAMAYGGIVALIFWMVFVVKL